MTNETTAPVERVARAMAERVGMREGAPLQALQGWLGDARAAIAAMPEATTQAAQIAALTEALEEIRDFPYIGGSASSDMRNIAEVALASKEPTND